MVSFPADAYTDIEKYLGGLEKNPHNLRTLKDVIRYMEETPEEEPQKWSMSTFKIAAEAGDEADRDISRFTESEKFRLHIGMEIARLLDKHKCDILVAPM